MSHESLFINGELLRLRREAQGWVLNDMATRACMSVKQIRQLEEGGISSFYSEAVKATAAKKVGALLGLSAEQVFAQKDGPVITESLIEPETSIVDHTSDRHAVFHADAINSEQEKHESIHEVNESLVASVSVEPVPDRASSSSNALAVIVTLVGLALALGIYLQPKEEVVTEPPPPLQVLPDAVDPASPASTPEANSSAAEGITVSTSPASVSLSQKNVVSAGLSASATAPAASIPRVSSTVGFATTKTPTSTHTATVPPESSASKPN